MSAKRRLSNLHIDLSTKRIRAYGACTCLVCVLLPAIAQAQNATSGIRVRISRFAKQFQPQRVLVVTRLNSQDRLKEQDVFVRATIANIESCMPLKCFSLAQRLCLDEMPRVCGCFDEEFLVEMHRKHAIDAVLYCEVAKLDAYDSASMSAHLLLVDVRDSVALMEADMSYDMDCNSVRESYRQYFTGPDVDTQPYYHSPSRFLEFCSRQLIAEVVKQWPGAKSEDK